MSMYKEILGSGTTGEEFSTVGPSSHSRKSSSSARKQQQSQQCLTTTSGSSSRTNTVVGPKRSRSRILSHQQIARLKEHKYSCLCTSMLDPFLQPYWNWLVLQVPIWMAPNLITIVGLIINVVTSVILIYISPDCKQPVPAWALLLCALGLFVYQSLDAIDGKQARRTKSSSPLGELFDHGCDSVSTVFVSLGVCVACRLGASLPFMFLQSFMAISLFYCAHWQTYVTGTLKFGFIDVTEAQIGIIIIHIVTAIFGGDFWTEMNIPVFGVPFYMLYVTIALAGAIPALYNEFKTILYQGAGKNGSSIAGTSVLSPVIPFGLVVIPAITIAIKSEQNIYQQSPALFILTFGLIAAKVTNRLVVAHMTKSEMDYFDFALIGPILLFLNQYFNYVFPEKYVLWLSLILVSIELVTYSRKVCLEICDSLNIMLFKIQVPFSDSESNHKSSSEPSGTTMTVTTSSSSQYQPTSRPTRRTKT